MTAPEQKKREGGETREGGGDVSRRRERAGARAQLLAQTLLVLAILGMVNYLAFRHYERWDWTSQGLFTLSDRTQKVIDGLAKPVDVYVFISRAERGLFGDVEGIMERYEAESPKIDVHYVDPDRDTAEYERLLQKFGVRAAVLESGEVTADVAAVVSSGGDHWRIKRQDMVGFDFGSFDDESGPKRDVKVERAVTGALVEVTRGEATKVCATTGHGEWSLEGSGERSLYGLEDELRRDNVEMEPFDTLGADAVPERCDAVFVVGPIKAFSDAEARMLEQYVRDGGRVLLALDPVFEGDRVQSTGLEKVARDLGVRVDRSIVLELDRDKLLSPSPVEPFLVTSYGDHEATEAVRAMGGRTVVHMARSVAPLEGQGGRMLLQTSEQGYGETNIAEVDPEQELAPDPDDIEGPVPLGVAVELGGEDEGESEQGQDAPRKGRLVVVGDSDWLTPQFLQTPQFANVDLASGLTGWLTERKALISIAPRKVDAQAITMTEGDLTGLAFRVLGLMPAAVLLLGFAVWWSRRS